MRPVGFHSGYRTKIRTRTTPRVQRPVRTFQASSFLNPPPKSGLVSTTARTLPTVALHAPFALAGWFTFGWYGLVPTAIIGVLSSLKAFREIRNDIRPSGTVAIGWLWRGINLALGTLLGTATTAVIGAIVNGPWGLLGGAMVGFYLGSAIVAKILDPERGP